MSIKTSLLVIGLLLSAAPVLAQAPGADPNAPVGENKDIATTKVNLQKCRPQSGMISFNFDKAPIQDVLDQIARIRCMNFILSDQVKGKNDITIVSRTPVSVSAAYAAFLSALEANGMSLVPAGAYWKVIERKDAAKAPLPLYEISPDGTLKKMTPKEGRMGDFPNSDAHVTLLYEIRYANKDQVQALIRNLMTKNADLQAPGGNLLILSDSGSNILRILEVLDRIDLAGSSNQLNVITPDYADVASIQSKLNEIYGVGSDKSGSPAAAAASKKKKKATPPPEAPAGGEESVDEDSDDITEVSIAKIIADERTNKLIVICSAKAFEKVLEVVRILDQPPTDQGGGVRMWVVPLANADAQKAASTLSSLAQSGGSAASKTANAKAGAKAKEAEKAAALFEGDVKITADETTNSLVIVASARDFRALRGVIDQLDVRRPQVFVEAAILEIALNQNRQVGLSAYGSTPVQVPIEGTSGTGIVTFANEGGKSIFASGAKVASGIALLQQLGNRADATSAQLGLDLVNTLSSSIGLFSFTGPAITLISDPNTGDPLVSFPSVGAVVNLLQGNSNVDILSTPYVMTTDNEKAEISVGDRVPVVKGVAGGAGGALGLGAISNVAYEDIKLKFSITPHVNADNEVRVELEQEVSDIAGQVTIPNGGQQPIIASRTVKSVIVTGDQRTVVIGGLMQDKKSDSESKVPFFGDIPVIGWLFKNWSDTTKKTNLVLLLTPYIVRNEEDMRKIYDLKMGERQAFIDAYFTEARRYDPYVNYDRKVGPLAKLVQAMELEMKRIENGGPGLEGEMVVGPGAEGFGNRNTTGGVDADGEGGAETPAAGGDDAPAPEAPTPEAPPAPPAQ
jgi:general secretion pathway protein D